MNGSRRMIAPQRAQAMKSAGENQQHALDQLQNAMDRMGSVGSLQQTIDHIRDLRKHEQA